MNKIIIGLLAAVVVLGMALVVLNNQLNSHHSDRDLATPLSARDMLPEIPDLHGVQARIDESAEGGTEAEQQEEPRLMALPKLPDEIMSLSSGKGEGVIGAVAVANGFIAQNPDLMIADFEVPYDATGSCIAVKKGNTELLDHINSVIADVVASGEMDEMVNQANLDSEY